MMTMPAIDSGGGLVRLRLDIAYDGTEFAGWAAQTGQRTVAGRGRRRVVDGVPHPGAAARGGRTDTGVHATGQVAHVDVPADALPHAYPRSARAGEPRVPAAGAAAGAVPADRCPGARHRPRPSGFRRPVLGVATPLRVPAVDRPVRRRTAAGALRDRLAAAAGRRRDGGGVARHWSGCTTSRRSAGTATAPPRSATCSGWTGPRRAISSPRTSPRTRSAGRWCARWSARCWRWGRTVATRPGAQACCAESRRSSDFAAAPPQGLTLVGVDYPPDDQLEARTR